MGKQSINVNFNPQDQINKYWKTYNELNLITVLNDKLQLKPDSKIFTIGSCFALEIRKEFRRLGYDVYPKYHEMDMDPEQVTISNRGSKAQMPILMDAISHYHTYSIRQEFEKHLGRWKQAPDDYWSSPNHWWPEETSCFQDPYRRAVFAKTPEILHETVQKIDRCVSQGIQDADIFLITLGLIETWMQKSNGRAACLNPGYNGGSGYAETEFHLSTFQENYENIKAITAMIREIRPDAKIVFSVSPVPLGQTFTDNDVVIANMESKSILRAALGQVLREETDITYYPSYEICSILGDVYTEDGRHVRPEIVQTIVQSFINGFTPKNSQLKTA